MTSSAKVADAMRSINACVSPQEEVWVLALDAALVARGCARISRGTIDGASVHPSDVLRPLVAYAVPSFILVHNHPSGDPTPSAQDRAVTKRMVDAGRLMGVQMLDHIIIAGSRHFSFRDGGML